MASRKHVGKAWTIRGAIKKSGKIVKEVERIVAISSEVDLDAAERNLRAELFEAAAKAYKKSELKDVTIEIESEVDK